ncbi:ABC transporter permease [Chroogloeocystis siderophila]|uniref:Iron ABC transporter permease n=1 Tax=Chroogloeocystis siderophila 5.2 s.c.1 TaxID=247279 RepID=A0A1U7HYL0_9CHRO|nr:iron ABC transporter permease [Chroogloeocystis siderophila]OKH28694.1 iron ABC transporter permease [Chroogloeocystis siderophila 5.2 s.c.1]
MQISRGISAHRPPLFLLVAGAITAVAIAIPLTYLVIRTAGVGREELSDLLLRPRTVTVLLNSAGMAAAVTIFSALIAIPLAFLTIRTDLPWRRFWLIVTTLPLAVPSYVGSFALIAAFGPRGSLLQLLLEPLGVQQLPSIYGWFGTILAITLFTYPYILLSVRAGLHGIDPAIEEAARSLGYSRRDTFFRVILPQLRPSIVAGSLLVALYALRDFGTPSLMRFDAFTRVIFLQYRSSFNRNLAAALALILVVLVLGILWLENKARSRARYYSRGASRRALQIKLGYWKLPALLFCAGITLISLVLPVGVTLFWLIRGLTVGGGDAVNLAQDMIQPALNSIGAAALAAIAATICALPVAILAVRFPSRITAIIERCSYVGFGLPGIVVALSLVFLGANYLPWIYQTLPILVFAYLVLFLPQSVGTVRSSLLQVNPQLEESAQVLGRTPWQTLREITLPLVRPGILSGAILVFLTAIKELPATLLLAPIGFSTLATKIWTATENVAFSDAAAAALTMLLVSCGSTLFMLSQEQ